MYSSKVQAERALLAAARACTERCIVFVLFKIDAETIAKELHCPAHHSDMALDERRHALNTWIATGGTIVATSGLGAGIDVPDVRHVRFCCCFFSSLSSTGRVQIFHHVGSHDIVHYTQEIGRGGRDGQLCKATAFVCLSSLPHSASSFATWAGTKGCRVASLADVIDGSPALPCYLNGRQVSCDPCLQRDRGT